jgi:hypothetical protein
LVELFTIYPLILFDLFRTNQKADKFFHIGKLPNQGKSVDFLRKEVKNFRLPVWTLPEAGRQNYIFFWR